jgi:hypothetical protein
LHRENDYMWLRRHATWSVSTLPQEMSRHAPRAPVDSDAMIRSVLAVLAGIAVLTVTSFAIEAVADPLMMRIFPQALPNRAAISHSAAAALFMFAYTAVCVAAGGYVTAWVARRSPTLHAVIMGVAQEALTVWAMMSIGKEAPLRNWIGALVLTIPAAWLGGLFRAKQIERNSSSRRLSRSTVR